MHKVVKYHVWWVVVSSQSALWGVKHGSGHWHCRSSFLQRKATQRKQRTQKQLHKIKQEINSTKGQHQAQASRHHQLDVPYQNQTTLSCHNFRGEKAAVRQQCQHTADINEALSRNIAIQRAAIPCPKNWRRDAFHLRDKSGKMQVCHRHQTHPELSVLKLVRVLTGSFQGNTTYTSSKQRQH